MKLRAMGFSTNRKGDFIGRLVAFSDDGEPLGFEHQGNFSRIQTSQIFLKKCCEMTGQSQEVVKACLTQVLKLLREGESGEEIAEAEKSPRPTIQVTGRFLRDITRDVIAALEDAQRGDPQVFRRGGVLVRIQQEGRGAVVQHFAHAALKGHVDRRMDFMKYQEGEERPARPPDDVVQDLLSLSPMPFPEVRALAAAPVVVPGGRILENEGFDEESGVYRYHNNLGPVPAMTLEQSKEMLLDEVLGDFPFSDQGSRANTLALLLQPFIRPAIPGLVPLFLIDAPTRGTGKGLLTEIIWEIALGHPAGIMVQPEDNEESRKRITALLLGGHTMIVLDNVRSLKSDVLSGILTAEYWSDRVLGRSQMASLENTTTWVATGNNVTLSDELARRTVHTRLDARVERPEERIGFRHPDLLAWVRQQRSTLVGACLGIVRPWLAAGMPRGTVSLGRYEAWAAMMGGLLDVAGVPGFLSNRDQIYTESEQETANWEAFCEAWGKEYAEQPATAKELLQVAVDKDLLVDLRAGRSQLAAQQRIGHALAKRRDRVFGGWVVRSAGRDAYSGNHRYRVEAASR